MDRIQIEGKNAITEALKAKQSIDKILIQNTIEKHKVGDILDMAKASNCVVEFVPKARLEKISKSHSHQGIIGYIAPIEYADFDDMLDSALQSDTPPLFLILDEIQDHIT